VDEKTKGRGGGVATGLNRFSGRIWRSEERAVVKCKGWRGVMQQVVTKNGGGPGGKENREEGGKSTW